MDRRIFIMGTLGSGALAVGCGGGGSSSEPPTAGDGTDASVGPAPAPPASPAPPAPSPAPAYSPLAGRYRAEQPRLFLVPPVGVVKGTGGSYWETPARAEVAAPKASYDYAAVGPTYLHVDVGSSWAWRNRNGDWIDASGVPQGATAHWSVGADAVATGLFTYGVDVTRGVQAAYAAQRWNAYIVRGVGASRTFASEQHATPPFLSVIYEDGQTAMLRCTAAVALEPSSAYAQGGAASVRVATGRHAALEFERPARAVRSATLTLPVLEHAAGVGRIEGFLADPPLNAEPVQWGLASGYPRDAGVRAHPGVVFAHLYEDAGQESDWIESQHVNVFDVTRWSPHLFDPAAEKIQTRLPFVHQGRWIKTKGNAALVPSGYGGEGFQPLMAGVGAIRVNIPGNTAADGAGVGYVGGFGCDLAMYLPDELCGVLDEIYVRYYLRLGVHPDEYLRDTKMFRTEAGAQAQYALHGGKFGIGASHWTQYGGNSGVAGGNVGWTNRNAWREYPADVVGGGMRPGVHSWDMLGYDRYYGSIGGLGASLYPGHWYCIETRLKLNTVDTSVSPFQADPAKNLEDAEFDVWLDGRKVLEMRDFSYRKLPLDYSGPASFDAKTKMGRTPLDRGLLVPIRQLGVTAVTLNDYNGGVLPAGTDRVKFYAGLVVARQPIGPMAGL